MGRERNAHAQIAHARLGHSAAKTEQTTHDDIDRKCSANSKMANCANIVEITIERRAIKRFEHCTMIMMNLGRKLERKAGRGRNGFARERRNKAGRVVARSLSEQMKRKSPVCRMRGRKMSGESFHDEQQCLCPKFDRFTVATNCEDQPIGETNELSKNGRERRLD